MFLFLPSNPIRKAHLFSRNECYTLLFSIGPSVLCESSSTVWLVLVLPRLCFTPFVEPVINLLGLITDNINMGWWHLLFGFFPLLFLLLKLVKMILENTLVLFTLGCSLWVWMIFIYVIISHLFILGIALGNFTSGSYSTTKELCYIGQSLPFLGQGSHFNK